MNKKVILSILLCLSVLFTGCSKEKEPKKETILVLAAASLTDVLSEMELDYEQRPGN